MGVWVANCATLLPGERSCKAPYLLDTAFIGVIFLSEPINIRIILGIILITLSLVGVSGYFDKRIKS